MGNEITVKEIHMLLSSESEDQWNKNCDDIKKSRNGEYPSNWYKAVIIGEIINEARKNWN